MKKILAFLLLPLSLYGATVTNQISDGNGNPINSRVVITPFVVSTVFGGTNVFGLGVGVDTTNGAWGANLLGGLYYVDQGLGQPRIPIYANPGDTQTNNLAYYAALATNPIPSFFVSGQGYVITVSNFNATQFLFANNQISIINGALVTNLVDSQSLTVQGVTTNAGIIYIYDNTGTNILAGFDLSLGGWFGPGLGFTNLMSTNLNYRLFTFPSATNQITANNTYWNYTATGNIAVTNIINVQTNFATWATLNVSNQTSGSITGYVTIPFVRAIGSQTTPAMVIPSSKVGMWSFLCLGGFSTNYIAAVQDAITDASLATNYVNQVSNSLFQIIPGPNSGQYPFTNDPTLGIRPTIYTNPPVYGISSVVYPFIGYPGAVSTGLVFQSVHFANDLSTNLELRASYQMTTNNFSGSGNSNSIISDYTLGINMNAAALIIIPGLTAMGEQWEYRWPNGGAMENERHWIFIPTNGVPQRFIDAICYDTNGYTGMAFAFDYLNFAPHTNSATSARQMVMHWQSGLPLIEDDLFNGSYQLYAYPNNGGNLRQVQDSTTTAHVLDQFDAVNIRYHIAPNHDFDGIHLGNRLRFDFNDDIGTSDGIICPNNGYFTGGLRAGGTGSVGNGNIVATNRFIGNGQSVTNIVLEDVVSPTNGVASANAVDFSVREATTNIAGAVSFTSLSNFNQTNYNYAIRWVINRTGANQTITVGSWETDSGRTTATTYTSTNNTTLGLLFKCQINVFTNVLSNVTFR